MNKLYYLSSCSTCKRIINQWSLTKAIDLIDVKKTPLDEKNLKELYKITNSYETLFNKRAQMLKKLNLNINLLDENDFNSFARIGESLFAIHLVFVLIINFLS